MKTLPWKPLLGIALVAALAAAAVLLPVDDWLKAFLAWVKDIGFWWGPLVLAGLYIPLTVAMVPGAIPTLGAGFAFGLWRGTLAVSVGSVLGSSVAFLLGRTLLRGWVERQMATRPRLRAVDQALEADGFKLCLLIRLSPAFPYNLMGYIFGATPIRFRDHFFASWVGMLPGTFLYVYIGHTARNLTEAAAGMGDEHATLRWIALGVGLLLALVATVFVTRLARRALRAHVPVDETQAEQGHNDDADS